MFEPVPFLYLACFSFVFEELLGLELCLKVFQGLLVVEVDSACPTIALVPLKLE